MQVFPESIGSNGQTVKNGQGVKNEIVSKADVRSGDGINSGSSNGGTDELGKALLSRNFENGTLVIPDYITELGPGAINLGFNLSAVKLNPDNISVVSDKAFDFGIQTAYYIGMDNINEICLWSINYILDMSEGTSLAKIGSIIESYSSLSSMLFSSNIIKILLNYSIMISTSAYAPAVSHLGPSSFFDINLSKKMILSAIPYFTIELDRDELPENILFINYNEQTGEIQNNLFTPDLNYVKGESFVAPWTLEELPHDSVEYLDLENLPDTYTNYDCTPISDEEMLSEAIEDWILANGRRTRLFYKTDMVKDGENLFITNPIVLINRKIETDQSANVSLPISTFEYQENRWYVLKRKEEPTP